ncbi:MAG: DNA-processing protein DprA [Candidatus Methylomirabilales bacterium]
MDEREAQLALSLVPHVGPTAFGALLSHFGSARQVLRASVRKLTAVHGIGPGVGEAIRAFPVERELGAVLKRLAQGRIRFLTWGDTEYPTRLRQISQPPPILYLAGTLTPQDTLAVAVVGTRHPSRYGQEVASQLAGQLALRGLTIVSGLARGVDGAAHRGALGVGGRTLAVLGSGVDVIYPPEHKALAVKVEAHGALLSEFPLGTKPLQGNFPQRNRVISGLALGVVVVEARAKSGALITAHCALEQGREVFAVPGPVTSERSRGCHGLIQEGAKLTEDWEDVIAEIAPQLEAAHDQPPAAVRPPAPDGHAGQILGLMEEEPVQIDQLISTSGLGASVVAAALLELEMQGHIRQLEGKAFMKVPFAGKGKQRAKVARHR